MGKRQGAKRECTQASGIRGIPCLSLAILIAHSQQRGSSKQVHAPNRQYSMRASAAPEISMLRSAIPSYLYNRCVGCEHNLIDISRSGRRAVGEIGRAKRAVADCRRKKPAEPVVKIEMHLKWRSRCEGGELFSPISEPCPKRVKAFARARIKLSRESGAQPCISRRSRHDYM